MGRKPVLDSTKRAQVCALIAMGASLRHAGRYVGCAASTIRHTAMHDREFRAQLRKAHLKAEMIPLKNMRTHANKSWRAAAWLLERLYPGFYAKRGGNDIPTDAVRDHIASLGQQIAAEIPDREVRARIDRTVKKWNEQMEKEQKAELDGLYDGRRWLRSQAAARARMKAAFEELQEKKDDTADDHAPEAYAAHDTRTHDTDAFDDSPYTGAPDATAPYADDTPYTGMPLHTGMPGTATPCTGDWPRTATPYTGDKPHADASEAQDAP